MSSDAKDHVRNSLSNTLFLDIFLKKLKNETNGGRRDGLGPLTDQYKERVMKRSTF